MTSPAQLKYLDAMGIPVWVSRDLVIDQLASAESTEKSQADDQTSVVENLLSSLEEQKQKQVEYKAPLQDHDAVVTNTAGRPDETVQDHQAYKDIHDRNLHTGNTYLIASTDCHNIYAQGSSNARWMVIGESPETIIDQSKEPYANEIGQLLEGMLSAVNITDPRNDAYLINIVPDSTEITADQQYRCELQHLLIKRINQVSPRIIFVVGQLAAQTLLKTDEPLARLRGKHHLLGDVKIPLVVSYYPSYLLSKPLDKRKAWEDLKLARSLIESSVSDNP